MNLWDTRNVISSQASEDGRAPSVSPDFPTIEKYGPDHPHANLSPRQASDLGLLTSGICGPHSTISSKSADLQCSIWNRLRQRMACTGSILFNLTWKTRDTPLRRSIYALRGSARTTNGRGCTSWPTPIQNDASSTHSYGKNRAVILKLPGVAKLAGWPTPLAGNATGGPESQTRKKELGRKRSGGGDLQAVALTSWVTPNARDWKDTHGMLQKRKDGRSRLDQLPRQANLAPWPTPCTQDGPNGGPSQGTDRLPGAASGVMPNGSIVPMASSAQLNPAHSRWIMGFPEVWDKFSPHYADYHTWQTALLYLSNVRNGIDSDD